MPRTAETLSPFRELNPGSFKLFMSVRELARASGISEAYIRKGVKEGAIPVIWTGNRANINVRLFLAQMDAASQKGAENNDGR